MIKPLAGKLDATWFISIHHEVFANWGARRAFLLRWTDLRWAEASSYEATWGAEPEIWR